MSGNLAKGQDRAHLYELKDLLKSWDHYQDRIHACDREYEKAAGKMPDKTEGRPVPEAQKQTRTNRNAMTDSADRSHRCASFSFSLARAPVRNVRKSATSEMRPFV
jgi:hypothetical protein